MTAIRGHGLEFRFKQKAIRSIRVDRPPVETTKDYDLHRTFEAGPLVELTIVLPAEALKAFAYRRRP